MFVKEIFSELDCWREQGEEIAMATLVRVRGSSPRLAGARLCLTRSGRMAGSVSGGCAETDVFQRGLQVLDEGAPTLFKYGISAEEGFEVGLSCGGAIDVLIEPFDAGEAWLAVRRAVETRRAATLAIGLAPTSIMGRKLAIVGDAAPVGSIDPALDAQVEAEARSLLLQGGSRIVGCSGTDGEASVYIEVLLPPLRLYIVGATHAAISLCRMAKELGYCVSIVDPRPVFSNRERFPEADELLQSWPDEVFDEVELDAHSYVVILTHDPKFDHPSLERALRSPARYVGAMGSRGTNRARAARLREEGFADEDLARIRAPIGLDLGGRTPEEIALAILAEMQAVRYDRDGKALRERQAPIHADA